MHLEKCDSSITKQPTFSTPKYKFEMLQLSPCATVQANLFFKVIYGTKILDTVTVGG
jgi:hypothetical protein